MEAALQPGVALDMAQRLWLSCQFTNLLPWSIVTKSGRPITILMADDDEEDLLLARSALEACRLANDLHCVRNGEELLDYLYRRGEYAELASSPRPGLILLDLNMPRKDGREALQEIKADPELRHIPIVILTTSKAEEDIYRTYDLGANSYITKPVTFNSLVEVMQSLGRYWFEIVDLPPSQKPWTDREDGVKFLNPLRYSPPRGQSKNGIH